MNLKLSKAEAELVWLALDHYGEANARLARTLHSTHWNAPPLPPDEASALLERIQHAESRRDQANTLLARVRL